jgi:plastocyanin
VNYVPGHSSLALVDSALAVSKRPSSAASKEISIDNFSFAPRELTVSAGTVVAWTNHDDIPHTVTSTEKKFGSEVLDTGQKFARKFTDPGTYPYFCKIHPMMTANLTVRA